MEVDQARGDVDPGIVGSREPVAGRIDPVAVTVFTCEVHSRARDLPLEGAVHALAGGEVDGHVEAAVAAQSSRSPNLSSTTLSIATITSTEVFVIVTEKVTVPPGSCSVVGVGRLGDGDGALPARNVVVGDGARREPPFGTRFEQFE